MGTSTTVVDDKGVGTLGEPPQSSAPLKSGQNTEVATGSPKSKSKAAVSAVDVYPLLCLLSVPLPTVPRGRDEAT